MQFLSREICKYGGSVLQAEDEIAGIGAAVGASFAGQKSMTATSGPGLSLKTEIMGLATIAELPLVIVNVQRGGPATGIPTKPEQSDLFAACFSAHGDALRPVLAPTCVADTFATTVEAFNMAEHYQTPVILLSDQEIAQRKESFRAINTAELTIEDRRRPTPDELKKYMRFRMTDVGVSPISHPGMEGGAYLASGIEHNEAGSPVSGGEMHKKMLEKRFNKFRPLHHRRDLFFIEGDPEATIGMISWGSTAGVCREALAIARKKRNLAVKLLVPRLVFPVIEEIYREFLSGLNSGLVVEQSFQGQFYRLLRMYVDVPSSIESMTHAGAQPFRPDEIALRLEQLAHRVVEKQDFAVSR
jgi:2-oxoglutarate ferredoxin oxidoreductase subunit alpha